MCEFYHARRDGQRRCAVKLMRRSVIEERADLMWQEPESKAAVWEETIGREQTDAEIEAADKKLMQDMRIGWPT